MDWSHFGLARRPFRPVVDTASYFPATGHEAALAAIQAAWSRHEPIVLLDGPAGVGKSLVARLWLERLPESTPRIVLANLQSPRPADLLQAILFDLNLPYRQFTEQELRLAVTEQLLGQVAAASVTILLIDEAQNLTAEALEEIRLLSNIESPQGSALFTVLVAQPRIHDLLKRTECTAMAQRIGTSLHLEPILPAECAGYLTHQLKAAGGEERGVIDAEAAALLGEASGGVPRLVNRLASTAGEMAAQAGNELIDVEAALEAIERLGLSEKHADSADVLEHPAKAERKPKVKAVRKKSA